MNVEIQRARAETEMVKSTARSTRHKPLKIGALVHPRLPVADVLTFVRKRLRAVFPPLDTGAGLTLRAGLRINQE